MAPETPAVRATTLLRARGLRVTGPRVEVLSSLLTADEGHLSAEALIERAAAADPPVHRATVYRALEGLTQAGVLGHVHLSVGPPTYRVAAPPDPAEPSGDLLVQCVVCGRIAAVPVDTWGGTADRILARTGFVLDPTHVALSGTCPDCTAHAH